MCGSGPFIESDAHTHTYASIPQSFRIQEWDEQTRQHLEDVSWVKRREQRRRRRRSKSQHESNNSNRPWTSRHTRISDCSRAVPEFELAEAAPDPSPSERESEWWESYTWVIPMLCCILPSRYWESCDKEKVHSPQDHPGHAVRLWCSLDTFSEPQDQTTLCNQIPRIEDHVDTWCFLWLEQHDSMRPNRTQRNVQDFPWVHFHKRWRQIRMRMSLKYAVESWVWRNPCTWSCLEFDDTLRTYRRTEWVLDRCVPVFER